MDLHYRYDSIDFVFTKTIKIRAFDNPQQFLVGRSRKKTQTNHVIYARRTMLQIQSPNDGGSCRHGAGSLEKDGCHIVIQCDRETSKV